MKRMIAGLSAIGLVFATALALAAVNTDQASATVRSKLATRCLIAVRHRPMESSAKQKPPISVWSMSMAASTVARSTSLVAMTATARQRPSSKCASWSSKTRSCFFSARWAPRRIPRSMATSMTTRCRNCSSPAAPTSGMIPSTFRGRWVIPSYGTEAHIYARYILQNLPNSKIGVLYQNDDFGKDYLNGLRDGLGDKAAKMIVATQSYETTDPTVDSQVVALQALVRPPPGSNRRRHGLEPVRASGVERAMQAASFPGAPFIKTMGRCAFDQATMSFHGDGVEQTRCLMRGMDETRNLGARMAMMPAPLADRVGNEAGLPTREALSTYLSKLDLSRTSPSICGCRCRAPTTMMPPRQWRAISSSTTPAARISATARSRRSRQRQFQDQRPEQVQMLGRLGQGACRHQPFRRHAAQSRA